MPNDAKVAAQQRALEIQRSLLDMGAESLVLTRLGLHVLGVLWAALEIFLT